MNIPCHTDSFSNKQVMPFFGAISPAVYLIFSGLAFTASPASAQNQPLTPVARYQVERANCFNGRSNEDGATCLKEANAALAANKKGKLTVVGAQYQDNAMRRCQALPVSDRGDCERRMRGEGTVSGSAETGGIFRELVVQEPAPSQQAGAPADTVK